MARQGRHEIDMARAFVMCEAGAAERYELLFQLRTRILHIRGLHHGMRDLSQIRIGNSEHRGIEHPGMARQHVRRMRFAQRIDRSFNSP
jgi:hypothetical protein